MAKSSTSDPATPPRTQDGKVDYAQDFFGKPAYLTVSGQLNLESYCLALSKVYTFGPAFRAERALDRQPLPLTERRLAIVDEAKKHGLRVVGRA